MTGAAATAPESERNTALLQWYETGHRDLPWRHTSDPYRILVAEVMLQQTQVERVIPFYERFLVHFETVEALAAARLGEVLDAWSGLGYNSRARRLREAARMVADGGWPNTIDGLRRLPGVGTYTAAAVGSFAFGLRSPAVDTNTRRVLSRWHGEPLSGSMLHSVAAVDMADADPAAWNQAVMELGATCCTPVSPTCAACPVAPWCAGPEVYVPPHPQTRFEGSGRQLRGAIVRRLVMGPSTLPELTATTGFDMGSVDEALFDLEADGLVLVDDDVVQLAD